MMEIINYSNEFEEGWLRCRVLAYLHTSMYEDVVTLKPTFPGRPSIELIAVENNEVVGILDLVLDTAENKTCLLGEGLGAFLPVIAIHPDYQSKGIGQLLMNEAFKRLENTDIEFIELYTRDDIQSNNFYKKLGFDLKLEMYDVFGREKGIRTPVYVQGIENNALKVKDSKGNTIEYLLVDAVYEVYTMDAISKIDAERVYPNRGYYKKIK